MDFSFLPTFSNKTSSNNQTNTTTTITQIGQETDPYVLLQRQSLNIELSMSEFIIVLSMSLLSMFSCLMLFFICYLKWEKLKNNCVVRILCFLGICDFITACFILIGLFIKNERFLLVQGFMMTWMEWSHLCWTLSWSLNLLLVLSFQFSSRHLLLAERFYLVFNNIVTFSFAFILYWLVFCNVLREAVIDAMFQLPLNGWMLFKGKYIGYAVYVIPVLVVFTGHLIIYVASTIKLVFNQQSTQQGPPPEYQIQVSEKEVKNRYSFLSFTSSNASNASVLQSTTFKTKYYLRLCTFFIGFLLTYTWPIYYRFNLLSSLSQSGITMTSDLVVIQQQHQQEHGLGWLLFLACVSGRGVLDFLFYFIGTLGIMSFFDSKETQQKQQSTSEDV